MFPRARRPKASSIWGAVAQTSWQEGPQTASIWRSRTCPQRRFLLARATSPFSAQGDEHRVEVAVHNGGQPIPTELLPVIFQPFERGAQDRAGLGLGLYVVREITKAHQGDVSVTSSVEDGTTFFLQLPRHLSREADTRG